MPALVESRGRDSIVFPSLSLKLGEDDLPTQLSCIVTQVPKLMEFLRMRSLRPGLGKLPIVAVIVVVDGNDNR